MGRNCAFKPGGLSFLARCQGSLGCWTQLSIDRKSERFKHVYDNPTRFVFDAACDLKTVPHQ